MRRAWLLVILLVACAPEPPDPEIRMEVSRGVGEILHPSEVYVRFLEQESQLVVFDKLEGAELARGPATSGARYPLSLAGRPCELESRGTELETDLVTTERPQDSTNRQPRPSRERKTLVAKVTLRCADGPAPGIRAAESVRATAVMAWLPLALLLGALGAFLYQRGDAMEFLGLGVWLVSTIGAFVVGWLQLDGLLCITVPALALIVGAGGATAVLLWASDKKPRVRGGAVGVAFAAIVGPAVLATIYPAWAAAAPLAAAGITLCCTVAALAVAVGGKGS